MRPLLMTMAAILLLLTVTACGKGEGAAYISGQHPGQPSEQMLDGAVELGVQLELPLSGVLLSLPHLEGYNKEERDGGAAYTGESGKAITVTAYTVDAPTLARILALDDRAAFEWVNALGFPESTRGEYLTVGGKDLLAFTLSGDAPVVAYLLPLDDNLVLVYGAGGDAVEGMDAIVRTL